MEQEVRVTYLETNRVESYLSLDWTRTEAELDTVWNIVAIVEVVVKSCFT